MTKIEYQQSRFPQRVTCINCGGTAEVEDFDFDPDNYVCCYYLCENCDWWTEWEVTDIGGEINTTNLYYRAPGKDDCLSWYEVRHWPHFWMPDGFKVGK